MQGPRRARWPRTRRTAASSSSAVAGTAGGQRARRARCARPGRAPPRAAAARRRARGPDRGLHPRRPSGVGQLPEPGGVRRLGPHHDQVEQEVVELLRVAAVGARLLADAGDRLRVELAEIARRLGQPASHRDRPGAALLERGVVEERVGAAVQDLVRERRGLGRLAEQGPHLARAEALEEADEPVHVGGLVQAVVERLPHDRMVGDLDRAGGRRSPGRRPARGTPRPSGRRPPCAGWAAASGGRPAGGGRSARGRGSTATAPGTWATGAAPASGRPPRLGARGTAARPRAGSSGRGRARARPRRRWPPPAARSRTAGRTASAARARARG